MKSSDLPDLSYTLASEPQGSRGVDHLGQHRDTPLAETLLTARTRSNYSLRHAAALLGVSKSALSRYERGEAIPAIDVLAAAASTYSESPDVVAAFNRTGMATTTGLSGHHAFPAGYSGEVFVGVTPLVQSPPTSVVLSWGPWVWTGGTDGRDGERVLVTGKSQEDVPVPLFFESTQPVTARFGLGNPEGGRSIHQEWEIAKGSWVGHHAGRLLRSLLENYGRTLEDFAQFLGSDQDLLRERLRVMSSSGDTP